MKENFITTEALRNRKRLDIAVALLKGVSSTAQPDSVTRWCQAALDMAEELMSLNEKFGQKDEVKP